MKVSLHPEADDEFAGAVQYYSEISPELGVRFYREMERLLREIALDPERFRKFDPPARRHFSRDFPYAIVFLDKPDSIWVLAVMHMKRQPGYWHSRL
ncbi:MAG TPA: type II toxin-antitoxin system RelE/ParE family toxin [Candidatus Polarisedimenticolia bacterium]|nr:type II toxin-antitoxin system RelE/ParE family toxin [Candidatus Polarisedimenticolia bacterium]